MTKKKEGKVTLTDIAKELGISAQAVSQALNPRPSNVKLSPATTERIRQLAAKRNYRADSRARSLRYGRFSNIGYFEASHSSVHYPLFDVGAGIFDAATDRNYHVVLVRLPGDLSREARALEFIFREAHLDGLIINDPVGLPRAYIEEIDATGLPVVYLNEKRRENSVYEDSLQGSEILTQHLLKRGCEGIIFLQSPPPFSRIPHYSVKDREIGYKNAMLAAGLTPEVWATGAELSSGLPQLLKRKKYHGILCYNDLEAVRLLNILHSSNIKVPDDVLVAGYGDDFSRECPIPMISMHVPFYEMAQQSVKIVLKLMEDPSLKSIPSIEFKTKIVDRWKLKSTATTHKAFSEKSQT